METGNPNHNHTHLLVGRKVSVAGLPLIFDTTVPHFRCLTCISFHLLLLAVYGCVCQVATVGPVA